MKNYLLPIFALFIVGCGNQRSQQVKAAQSIETGATDSTTEHVTEEPDIKALPDSTSNIAGGESLNDIRFGNWTDKDWCDNDYFRALRKYIDSYDPNNDEYMKSVDLESYRATLIKSKFAIGKALPHIGGGMGVDIIFLDMPNLIFHAWIYTYVDINSKNICGYAVREFRLIDVESPFTKEAILTIIKEHPEYKLW